MDKKMKLSKAELAHIRWKCRRGMLELDELLHRFFDQEFIKLTVDEQHQFQQLLERHDPELFAWLLGHAASINPSWQKLIQKIRLTAKLAP